MTDLRLTTANMVFDPAIQGRLYIRDEDNKPVAEVRKSIGRRLEIGLEPHDNWGERSFNHVGLKWGTQNIYSTVNLGMNDLLNRLILNGGMGQLRFSELAGLFGKYTILIRRERWLPFFNC